MAKRNNLINARGNRSQQTVAAELGMRQQQLSNYECGRRNPSLHLAYKLSTYYDIPVEKLFPDLINQIEN